MGDGQRGEAEAMLKLGIRVQAARKKLGLSQEKLGDAVGLHRTYIGHIEQARARPSAWVIVLIARRLGIQPGDLLDDL